MPHERDAGWSPRKWACRIAITLGSVVGAVGSVAGCQILVNDGLSFPPPSDQELAAQRQFVSAHLPDARDFRLGTLDCDDHGDGFGSFTTGLRPKPARAAFLIDLACSSYADPEEPREIAATCRSGKFTLYLLFTGTSGGRTDGSLTISQR